MIPLVWLVLGVVGVVGAALVVSGSKISDEQVQDAFCAAWSEGVRDPQELQYVVARVLMPESVWPPQIGSPADEVAAWEQLGQLARRVAERGPVCR